MPSKRQLNPHRFDASPREKSPWAERGYRRRSEISPGQSMTLAERRIEELERHLGVLEAAVLNVRDASLGNVQRMVDGRAFNRLEALLPRTSQRTIEDRDD